MSSWVHKAKNLNPEWVEDGPEDCYYNGSVSGWFDGSIFEDWFMKVIIPYCRHREGKKAIIEDRTSSSVDFITHDMWIDLGREIFQKSKEKKLRMLSEFCNIETLEYSEFLIYFRQFYTRNCKQWAYYYRRSA
ncbi:hypothetical protein HUJ04_001426 [Dendroctonus ponderosae]|nr:hypothetical protein HUJ04_001426 [Dendroctonus ponderosae]